MSLKFSKNSTVAPMPAARRGVDWDWRWFPASLPCTMGRFRCAAARKSRAGRFLRSAYPKAKRKLRCVRQGSYEKARYKTVTSLEQACNSGDVYYMYETRTECKRTRNDINPSCPAWRP